MKMFEEVMKNWDAFAEKGNECDTKLISGRDIEPYYMSQKNNCGNRDSDTKKWLTWRLLAEI